MARVSGSCSVCVTGGSGYLGSSLIKRLLLNGFTVHATLHDESKVGLLKSLPNAATNLRLPLCFPCRYSFAPHSWISVQKYGGSVSCDGEENRKTVQQDDGSGFKDLMVETCWTPLHFPFPFSQAYSEGYMDSKTLTEKEALEFGDSKSSNGLEVVSLVSGLVVGNSLNSYVISQTTIVAFSQFTDEAQAFYALRCIEYLDGKIPLFTLKTFVKPTFSVWNNLPSVVLLVFFRPCHLLSSSPKFQYLYELT